MYLYLYLYICNYIILIRQKNTILQNKIEYFNNKKNNYTSIQFIFNMENENAQYRNRSNRILLLYRSRPFTRIQHCSTCGLPGHNSRTCDSERMRNVELECSVKCQTIEQSEFEGWLSNTYDDELLKAYAVTKGIIPLYTHSNLATCIHAIGTYIYNTYRFQSDYSIPDVIHTSDLFVTEMVNIMSFRASEPSELSSEAALYNQIRSGEYFQALFRFGQMMQNNAFQESSLIKRYKIENIMEELTDEKKEEIIECCICYDEYNRQDFVQFGCNHEYCKDCIKKALRAKPLCPCCRGSVKKIISRRQEIYKEFEELVV